MQVVLMAGGGGTRLWPVSRRSNPKQFFTFNGRTTLLEETYTRATAIAHEADIFVATIADYAPRVKELLPAIHEDHVFLEPSRRDTTAAFASIAVRLQLMGKGDVPTMFMWSDHVFTAEQAFLEDLQKIPAVLANHPNSVVIMGHVPTSPETTLGYIEAGEHVDGLSDVFVIKHFKEKPDLKTAETYLASGKHFWNIGSFSFRPNYLLEELEKYEPEFMQRIASFKQALQAGDEALATSIYNDLKKISIEYTFIEKTPLKFVISGDYGWSDVGNWRAVHDVFGAAGDHMPQGHHIHVDGQNNYVYNTTKKVVSTIGIKNSIVVVTEDAVLVADKAHAHKVKDVVAQLEADGKNEYL